MREATSTLGALPCRAAVMRSVIGNSFLKAAKCNPAVVVLSRRPLRVPVQKECSPATAMVPVTTPNERRSRACSPAQAPPTPAGRGPSGRQSRARSPAIAARNAPRRGTHSERGLPAWQCRGLNPPWEGGNGPTRASRQRTGRPSRRRLGGDSRPRRVVWQDQAGAAQPRPAAADAPLRKNHADPRVHCALAWQRPTVGIHQTQSHQTHVH